MPAYGSPQLIAVNHVLLRLPVPRHSPCALCSLTFFLSRISLCLPYVVLCGVRLRYAFALQLSYAILFLRLQVFTRSIIVLLITLLNTVSFQDGRHSILSLVCLAFSLFSFQGAIPDVRCWTSDVRPADT